MKISHCIFPEGLFYDVENLVWMNIESNDRIVTVGITTVLSYLAGILNAVKIKPVGTSIEKGKSIGTIESNKYFGVVRSPINGKIVEINKSITDRPKLVNDLPYTNGWFVRIEAVKIKDDLADLRIIEECHDRMSSLIQQLHVRCFAAFPDHEMLQIGVECSATLSKLEELLTEIQTGDIVHLVSDDTTADLEMVRWTDENGQLLLDTRREENLFHFLIKKLK